MKDIHLGNDNELIRLDPTWIVFIKSEPGHNAMMTTIDGREHQLSRQLGDIEKLLETQLKGETEFFRVAKSLVVNRDYIFRIKSTEKKIELLVPMTGKFYSLKGSEDILPKVKLKLERKEIGKLMKDLWDELKNPEKRKIFKLR